MNRTRMPRRICRYCHRRRCKKVEHVFCSSVCAHAARRKSRPLCPVCRTRPVKLRHQKTCGRSCGAKSRGDEGQRTIRKALAMMAEGRRQAFAKRIVELFRIEVDGLERATSRQERAKWAWKIYRFGYRNGASASYYRYAIAARRSA